MSPAEVLRAEASSMRHAIVYDQIVTPDGRVESLRAFHYLTCVRCKLEAQAERIEAHYDGGEA